MAKNSSLYHITSLHTVTTLKATTEVKLGQLKMIQVKVISNIIVFTNYLIHCPSITIEILYGSFQYLFARRSRRPFSNEVRLAVPLEVISQSGKE
jgi:hypothetical protein